MDIVNPHRPAPVRVSSGRIALLLTGMVVALVAFFVLRTPACEWALLKWSLHRGFPQVTWISTAQLSDWLADPSRVPPVLLDVRTEQEWNVSHLPGAQRVEPGAPVEALRTRLPRGSAVVAYCAVGYRSAEFAKRLGAAGFANVCNLEGSIFAWGNEHRPLMREGAATTVVHPYDRIWGRLLRDDVRAPMP